MIKNIEILEDKNEGRYRVSCSDLHGWITCGERTITIKSMD